MPPRPLRRILSFQSALVAAIPFMVVGLLVIFWFLPKVKEDVNLSQAHLARAIASETDGFLNSTIVSVRSVALFPTDAETERRALEHVLDANINASKSLKALYIVTPSGRVTAVGLLESAANQRSDLQGTDLSKNTLFKEALKLGQPVWSDAFLSLVGGGLSVGLAVPTANYIVIGEVESGRMTEFLKTIEPSDEQLVMVLDKRGQVIADQSGQFTAQQLNLSNIPLVNATLREREAATGFFNFNGVEMIGSMVLVPSINWKVLVAQPVKEAYHPAKEALLVAFSGLFLAVGLGVLWALFFSDRLAVRFKTLEAHAHRLASTQERSQWPTSNITEFNQLAIDLNKMADAISDRERQLSTLMSNVPGMVYRCKANHSSGLLFVSDGCLALTGFDEAGLTGENPRSLAFLIHPDDLPRVLADVEEQLKTKPSYQTVYRINAKDGSQKWVLDHGQRTSLASEGTSLLEGILVDITERKAVEAERERLLSAVEQAAEDILITDAGGVIVYANSATGSTTGFSPAELVGKRPNVFKSGKHDKAFYDDLWSTIMSGRVWTGRFLNKTKDGRILSQDASIAPICDQSGQINGFVATRRDVTAQVEMEQKLLQSQKMEAIGTMAGGIAHDFNNILTAIVGYTELAILNYATPEQMRDLAAIKSASDRATELVKQILAFSRMSKEEAKPIQPKIIVKEALKLIRASTPATIDIMQYVDSNSVILSTPADIHRVVVNLCTNAALAMADKGGVLEVRLDDVNLDAVFSANHLDAKPGKYVRLTVKDTGCGMTEEVKAHIFEPFFTTRKEGKGTGMGLSVVHGIVKSRGGAISVTSKPGAGTTFQVYFPVEEKLEAVKEEKNTAPLRGSERVLFVDDEIMVAELAEKALGGLGYAITACTSSLKALEIFSQNPQNFDLVITDMTMPNMTGDELVINLRKIRPDLPVILCTGYSDKISQDKAKEIGIDEFVLKPIATTALSRIIRRTLDSAG